MNTQKEEILTCLILGEKLTVLSAIKKFGCYALSQRIGELKRDGYGSRIQSAMITLKNKKRVKQYWM